MLFVITIFPLVLPILIANMSLTKTVLSGNNMDFSLLFFLLAFSAGMILLAVILFPFIWSEE